jgi:glutamine synthetase
VPAGRGLSTRFEVRNPDPAGNPYLQFAVMLAAGLKGIEEKVEPSEPVEVDIYRLKPEDRKRLGIESLPADLGEALNEFEKSELLRETLGAHVFTHYLYIKRKEWNDYQAHISNWEIENFLPIL